MLHKLDFVHSSRPMRVLVITLFRKLYIFPRPILMNIEMNKRSNFHRAGWHDSDGMSSCPHTYDRVSLNLIGLNLRHTFRVLEDSSSYLVFNFCEIGLRLVGET